MTPDAEPASGHASFREDNESYGKPLRDATAKCKAAFMSAAQKVKGAEAKTQAAIADLRSLREFREQVAAHLDQKSFKNLPGVKRGRERVAALHQLTVGPWRGVFLVRPDGSEVIGLVFSKHPHDLGKRLDEVTRRYSTNVVPGGESDVPKS